MNLDNWSKLSFAQSSDCPLCAHQVLEKKFVVFFNLSRKSLCPDEQTDRQMDIQTDRQTDRQTYRQTYRQTDKQTDKQTDRKTDGR